jgi:chromosome segregation ATPase
MENLKRKLSSTRRPETASRNLLPELNQYKQNNVALQKQIESLMAKLNESKKSERALKTSLDEITQSRNEWQEKTEEAGKTAKNAQALQNTIDHLENRLEIANIDKLDAEEQLYNFQSQNRPFDFKLPNLHIPPTIDYTQEQVSSGLNLICIPTGLWLISSQGAQTSHMSMSTVFSSTSPISPEKESQELSTLATFVAHIEQLQDQVRRKDAEMQELERSKEQLQHKHDQIEQEQHTLTLQMEIQSELLKKTRRTDAHIEQMRTAIIDRETIINEKEKALRAVERQLEYHKLLLQAQIRRHATMTLHATANDNPLPELSKLATRADIDRWIERLQERLKKEKPMASESLPNDPKDAQIADLRQEIDFYVREIIYYKLDIRGYKSDIKKLKKITTQLSSFGSRTSDLESDTSSLRPAATPSHTPFPGATPELGTSDSPALSGPAYRAQSMNRPMTPPPSDPICTSKALYNSNDVMTAGQHAPLHPRIQAPMTPQTPTRKTDAQVARETESYETGALLAKREPTVCGLTVFNTLVAV